MVNNVYFCSLLDDEAAVGLDGDLRAAFLVDLEGGDRRWAVFLVDVIAESLAGGEHRQVEGER